MPKLTEVTEEILVGWPFCPPILNRVNFYSCFQSIFCTDSDKSVAEWADELLHKVFTTKGFLALGIYTKFKTKYMQN